MDPLDYLRIFTIIFDRFQAKQALVADPPVSILERSPSPDSAAPASSGGHGQQQFPPTPPAGAHPAPALGPGPYDLKLHTTAGKAGSTHSHEVDSTSSGAMDSARHVPNSTAADPYAERAQEAGQSTPSVSAARTPPMRAKGKALLTLESMTPLGPQGAPDMETLPSPAKAYAGAPLSNKAMSLMVHGQPMDPNTKALGSVVGFRLDCAGGGSPHEVFQLLSSYDTSKLSFHVVRAGQPSSPNRSDAGPPDTEHTATPSRRSELNDSNVTPPTPAAATTSSLPESQKGSPTRATQLAVGRPFAMSYVTTSPGARAAVRTPNLGGSTTFSTSSAKTPRPEEDATACPLRNLHGPRCSVYKLDCVANVSYWLSFYATGLPIVYFDQAGDVPFRPVGGRGNPNDFWRSVTPLMTEGMLVDGPSPSQNELAFRHTVSPDAIHTILDHDAAQASGEAARFFFRSPTPGSLQQYNRLSDLRTPVELNNSMVGRSGSATSPMRPANFSQGRSSCPRANSADTLPLDMGDRAREGPGARPHTSSFPPSPPVNGKAPEGSDSSSR
jgi:hypothetical protein